MNRLLKVGSDGILDGILLWLLKKTYLILFLYLIPTIFSCICDVRIPKGFHLELQIIFLLLLKFSRVDWGWPIPETPLPFSCLTDICTKSCWPTPGRRNLREFGSQTDHVCNEENLRIRDRKRMAATLSPGHCGVGFPPLKCIWRTLKLNTLWIPCSYGWQLWGIAYKKR